MSVLLGRIVRLQIQRSKLKQGEKPNRYFDPAPLLAVEALTLTPHGAVATLPDGLAVLDVHHHDHPATRNLGDNDLSVGFTAHYARMRERFGPHLANGCAGENILIETEYLVAAEALAGGLVIRPAGGGEPVRLRLSRHAPPCREFSGYAARSTDAEAVKDALQFLDDGVRGFYFTLAHTGPVTVRVGDEVAIG